MLGPDLHRSYRQLAEHFHIANFVSSLWNYDGAKQLLRWVAPSLPPPGLTMTSQKYVARLGDNQKELDVALLVLESRSQPTLTPEHTDATPSVLCILVGRKVVHLREAKIATGRLEARKEELTLHTGDALYIPPGVHHCVESSPNTIAFSIGIQAPADLYGPTVWRGASRSWRPIYTWSDATKLWSDDRLVTRLGGCCVACDQCTLAHIAHSSSSL